MNRCRIQRAITVTVSILFMGGAVGMSDEQTMASSHPSVEHRFTSDATRILNASELESLPGSPLLAQQQQTRVALVIGNAAYENDPLANTINDATAIHQTLDELEFEMLPLVKNANRREMIDAIGDFQDRLEAGAIGVFYYAGHGVQVNGTNYLVPIGADLEREADAEFDAIDLNRVIRAMDAAETSFNVLIVDACRDNPFYRTWRRTRGSNTRGLSAERPPRGTLIAYATEPNNVAEDGGNGERHSPYTRSLLTHLRTPRISIFDMLTRVTEDVLEATEEQQSPYFEGTLRGFFSFNPGIEVDSEPIVSRPSNPVTEDDPEPSVTPPQTVLLEPEPDPEPDIEPESLRPDAIEPPQFSIEPLVNLVLPATFNIFLTLTEGTEGFGRCKAFGSGNLDVSREGNITGDLEVGRGNLIESGGNISGRIERNGTWSAFTTRGYMFEGAFHNGDLIGTYTGSTDNGQSGECKGDFSSYRTSISNASNQPTREVLYYFQTPATFNISLTLTEGPEGFGRCKAFGNGNLDVSREGNITGGLEVGRGNLIESGGDVSGRIERDGTWSAFTTRGYRFEGAFQDGELSGTFTGPTDNGQSRACVGNITSYRI